MGAFGNSNFTNIHSDAAPSGANGADKGSANATGQAAGGLGSTDPSTSNQQTPQQSIQQPQAPPSSEAPGSDLVDGFASILFAPGRAIVAQFHPPTMKDLPIIIGLSAAIYWALYKFVWPMIEESFMPFSSGIASGPTRRRNSRRKKVAAVEIEEEEDE